MTKTAANSRKLETTISKRVSTSLFSATQGFFVVRKENHTIYPPGNQIFAAFNHTPFSDVKVVIIGQDPYHGAGQANGLCFSVADGIKNLLH